MRQREPAICLRASDYSETSQVVVFLTRGQGVVRLLAKGTKRPKSKSGGAIDLMSEGELVFTLSRSGGLGTLVEFVETAVHTALRRDTARLNAGLYVIDVTGQMLAAEDPHPEVFDLLHNALDRLQHPEAPLPAVVAYFLWRLVGHVGLLGKLDACVACSKTITGSARQRWWFSATQGGALCDACATTSRERVPLSPRTRSALAALAAAAGGKKVSLEAAQAQAAGKLLNYHLMHQLGKPLRAAKGVFGRSVGAPPAG